MVNFKTSPTDSWTESNGSRHRKEQDHDHEWPEELEEVTSFKYLGATLCKDGTFAAEIRIRIASVMAAMARLNKIW